MGKSEDFEMKSGTYLKKTFFFLMFIAFYLPVIACDLKEGNTLFSEDDLDVPYHLIQYQL
jgi:hypothetical protein